jgi:hypothetical protein
MTLDERRFSLDQRVKVKMQNNEGTRRTPNYIRGKVGKIIRVHGVVRGHEHDHKDDWGPMYTVLFDSRDVFGFSENEKVLVDLHDSWLESTS